MRPRVEAMRRAGAARKGGPFGLAAAERLRRRGAVLPP